jgi:hypothetical protein
MVRSIFALAAVLSVASASGAATVLTTPLVVPQNGQIPECYITNIDTRPATISVKFTDFFGDDQTQNLGCPTTLGPSESCYMQPLNPTSVYCSVTSSTSRIRAAMVVFNGTTLSMDAEVPATK